MKLSPPAFNRFLKNIGQLVSWRRSSLCPCVTVHSGAADPACPVCFGKGVFWGDAISGHAGITNQNVAKKFADFGQFVEGDAILTVPSDTPLYAMGRFDRIGMLNGSDPFSRVLIRGDDDKLDDLTGVEISRVFWFEPDGHGGMAIVEGGIPSVSSDGTMTWVSGEPAAGVQYSIAGTRVPEYFVYMQLPSDRNEHMGATLPKKVQLRLFDLFGR